MVNYIYTNSFGTYLFDNQGDLLKKSSFKNSVEYAQKIFDEELLNEEKNLAKNAKEDVIFLTRKKEYPKENKSKYADFSSQKIDKIYSKIIQSYKGKDNQKKFVELNQEFIAQRLRSQSSNDMIVIQCMNSIEDTDRLINSMAVRLREWYSIYNPELSRKIGDHRAYASALLDAVKEDNSIGSNFTMEDMVACKRLANEVLNMCKYRDEQELYLSEKIREVCPNLAVVATELIGARLFALAGSLRRLALFPASTIQTLGAEKAMFRHLKTGDRPPKYGLIILHPLIAKAKRNERGKIARTLASKISLAAKVDFFGGEEYKGYEMKDELEKQFGSY